MSPEDRRRYLVESLFLNYNTYESEMLDAYARKLTAKKKGRGRAAGRRAVRRRLAVLAARRSCWRRSAAAEEKPQAAPRIRVEPESFDFGKALPDKTLRKEFTIRNFGDARPRDRGRLDDLRLHGRPRRGDAAWSPGARPPCGSRFETRRYSGQVERQVLVRSNDPKTPLARGAA